MAYVNKAKKGTDIVDINDARIPEATNFDVGKAPIVQADGTFVFGEAGTSVSVEENNGYVTGINLGDDVTHFVGSCNVGAEKNKWGVFILTSVMEASNGIMAFTSNEFDDLLFLNDYSITISAITARGVAKPINYGLQVLGLEERVDSIGDFIEIWNTYKENQNYAFLLMGLFLLACQEAGIKFKDANKNEVKYIINIDQETPTNSNFTEYVLTEDTSNGYELKYVGTHYTIADTATIMTWNIHFEN